MNRLVGLSVAMLVVAVAIPLSPVRAATVYLCFGEPATIVGTSGRDIIKGTSGRDVIRALEGNDVVYAAGGPDLICGDKGDDSLHGDRISATKVAADSASGADSISGGVGNDQLRGNYTPKGGVADVLVGNAGDDFMDGGNDAAQRPHDIVWFDGSVPVTVTIDAWDEGTATGQGNDRFRGTPNLIGSSAGDTINLRATGGLWSLWSDEGNDILNLRGSVFDEMGGGEGDDVFNLYATFEQPENGMSGDQGDDTVYGTELADSLWSFAYDPGSESIFGYGGDDSISVEDGVSGNDTVRAGDGSDTCTADSGDLLFECEL